MKTTSLWTEATRAHVARHAAAASLLALAACGGGGGGGAGPGPGGGSPPPPPPPPPVANAAPSAVVTVTNTAPQEGRPFTLDGSTSSDADNDPLTFSWRQTAGPAATIADATLAKLENLRAPEVTEDKVGTFELTVSDGKTTSKKSVNVTFTNIYQTPRFAAAPALEQTLPVNGTIVEKGGNFNEEQNTFFGVSAAPGGSMNIQELDGGWNGTVEEPFDLSTTTQSLDTFIRPTHFQHAIQVSEPAIYSLEESAKRLRYYAKADRANSTPFVKKAEIVFQRTPCAISQQGVNGKIVVGRRGGGFSLLKRDAPDMNGNFTYGTYQTTASPLSLCALSITRFPISGGATFNTPNPQYLYDLLAYDADTNKIYRFNQNAGTTENTAFYSAGGSASVNLDTTETLRFVKAVLYAQGGTPSGLALLFTDDQRVGTHRMVIVGLDADRQIVQQTISWTFGVPSDAVSFYGSNGQFETAIAVISPDSPEAMVFRPNFATNPGDNVIPMTGPEYFEIGLGATLGEVETRSAAQPDDKHSLLIMDSESHEARIYGPLPY